jgi:hypothetical protein
METVIGQGSNQKNQVAIAVMSTIFVTLMDFMLQMHPISLQTATATPVTTETLTTENYAFYW